jgi:hypothetical protein
MMRAVYLKAEFRGIVQGDLSITAYCHRLKSLTDSLCDVDMPVIDQVLVLNCLRGLNPRFADITTIVTMQSPLPSFAQTWLLLTLREMQLTNVAHIGNQTALYGAGSSSGGYHTQGHGDGNNSSDRNRGNYYGKKKKTGRNPGGSSGGNQNARAPNRAGDAPRGASHVGPWVCFNPYTGQAQQMNGPPPQAPSNPWPNNSVGLLSSRPVMQPNAQSFTFLAPLHGQAFGTNPPPIPGYYNAPPPPALSTTSAAPT